MLPLTGQILLVLRYINSGRFTFLKDAFSLRVRLIETRDKYKLVIHVLSPLLEAGHPTYTSSIAFCGAGARPY